MFVLINLYDAVYMPDGKQYKAIFGNLLKNYKTSFIIGNNDNCFLIRKKDVSSYMFTNKVNMDNDIKVTLYDEEADEYKVYTRPNFIYFIDLQIDSKDKINLNLKNNNLLNEEEDDD